MLIGALILITAIQSAHIFACPTRVQSPGHPWSCVVQHRGQILWCHIYYKESSLDLPPSLRTLLSSCTQLPYHSLLQYQSTIELVKNGTFHLWTMRLVVMAPSPSIVVLADIITKPLIQALS